MTNLCTVSGSIKTLGLAPLAGATVTFAPIASGIGRADSDVIVPTAITATTGSAGAFSIDVLPGPYSVTVAEPGGWVRYDPVSVAVPDAQMADFANIMAAPLPPTIDAATQAVFDAQTARDAAQLALDAAAASAAAAATDRQNAQSAATAAAGSQTAASVSAAAAAASAASINPASIAITGGAINGTPIGLTAPAAGQFTTLAGTTALTSPLLTNAGTLALSATGANPITASTNGAERLRIDGGGNVGLGTAAPEGKFDVYDANAAILKARVGAGGSGVASLRMKYGAFEHGFYVAGTNALVAYDYGAGSERLRIDSAGNVGIGTSNPRSVAGYASLGINGSTGSLFDLFSNGTRIFTAGAVAGEAYVQTATAVPLTFGTNGTERLRIDASGNLLVGTTSAIAGSKLSVVGDVADLLIRVRNDNASSPAGIDVNYNGAAPNGTDNVFFQGRDTSAVRFNVRSNGGIANFSANNVNLSDERVKTDIAPVGSYWDKIKAVEVVTYKYLDQTHDDDNLGVIAQQVEAVAPEFVSNDGFGETPEDGIPLKSIYEADLHYATIKALQEAMERIEILEARLAAANL